MRNIILVCMQICNRELILKEIFNYKLPLGSIFFNIFSPCDALQRCMMLECFE